MGYVRFGASDTERKSLVCRRSLYIVKPLVAGQSLSPENVRNIRPGFGLPPKYLEAVIGKRVRRSIPAGTPLSWEMFD